MASSRQLHQNVTQNHQVLKGLIFVLENSLFKYIFLHSKIE